MYINEGIDRIFVNVSARTGNYYHDLIPSLRFFFKYGYDSII